MSEEKRFLRAIKPSEIPEKFKLTEKEKEFYEHFEWVKAVQDWRHGEVNNLALHVDWYFKNDWKIPKIFQPIIAEIIALQITPNFKGRSNQKYPPSKRLQVARDLERKINGNKIQTTGYPISENSGAGLMRRYLNTTKSASQLRRAFKKLPAQWRKKEAHSLDVSVETIKKWEKELRHLKKKWPDI